MLAKYQKTLAPLSLMMFLDVSGCFVLFIASVDESVDGQIMARLTGRLTEQRVRKLGKGWHNDGGGLYLRIADKERRWWVFRYGGGGKRYHGLGPVNTVSLAEAREQARACRALLLRGEDPIAAGKARRAAAALEAANAKTFAWCCDAYWDVHCASWTNQKHAREWKVSLATHVLTQIGALPVAAIDTAQVLRVLQPAWTKIPETASRLRSRIESVLDWARVNQYREGENPARWRGHLDHLLPARKKLKRRKHHAALPYQDVPAFLRRLRELDDTEARALEFLMLTAARANEVVGVTWNEIKADRDGWIWIVPPEKIKARRTHRVPLAAAARAILERTPRERRHGPIFPGVTGHMLWQRVRALTATATVHGFRSSFRDWAAEQTNFPRELCELALAHRVADEVEAAYQRSDLLQKRRRLIEMWEQYCTCTPSKAAEVTPIRA
jgi:integrase